MIVPSTIWGALAFFIMSASVIPLSGQRGGGLRNLQTCLPSPVAPSIPMISTEITGPGRMFESLMELNVILADAAAIEF
jgi:hypothetical protein